MWAMPRGRGADYRKINLASPVEGDLRIVGRGRPTPTDAALVCIALSDGFVDLAAGDNGRDDPYFDEPVMVDIVDNRPQSASNHTADNNATLERNARSCPLRRPLRR
jgi:hypothetical protein